MFTVNRSVKVTVSGLQFAVKTDAKPKYVKDLATFVTGKMKEVGASGRIGSTQSQALLAAMTIADELHQLQQKQAKLEREVKRRTEKILGYLTNETKL